ncbi:MAG: diaminopimelate decarboxylase [Chitinophagaceae bacterium]|nr:diaminopimelate decarboxylase [Chitinophagaceae bacterium]
MHDTIPSVKLLEIAKDYGTPTYVYDADVIREQYQKLESAFSSLDCRFFYAAKALTNINILKYIRGLNASVDCSSVQEVQLALLAGFSPENILYTSNGVSFDEICEAAATGAHINIDSLSNLEKFGKKFGSSYPVGIRLRPNIRAGGNYKISTGHDSSKFGIPIEQLQQITDTVNRHKLQVKILHIHTGSDVQEPDTFIQSAEKMFQIAGHFPEAEVLDLGGGFKVAYRPDEKDADLKKIASELENVYHTYQQQHQRSFRFWFEPGKFLVSRCGYFLTEVTVLKPTDTINFVSVNSGFNHLLRPMFYDAYHHIINLSNPGGVPGIYTVTGNICETDTFASDRLINEVREGDILVFCNAGAYGFQMASQYNSRYRPAEVMITDGKTILIRKRDSFDDLLKNQIL